MEMKSQIFQGRARGLEIAFQAFAYPWTQRGSSKEKKSSPTFSYNSMGAGGGQSSAGGLRAGAGAPGTEGRALQIPSGALLSHQSEVPRGTQQFRVPRMTWGKAPKCTGVVLSSPEWVGEWASPTSCPCGTPECGLTGKQGLCRCNKSLISGWDPCKERRGDVRHGHRGTWRGQRVRTEAGRERCSREPRHQLKEEEAGKDPLIPCPLEAPEEAQPSQHPNFRLLPPEP